MTDKELLELAAKAAGYDKLGLYWSDTARCLLDGEMFSFDPLTDDGDALRLAVKLKIDVSFPSYIKPERPAVHAGKYWHRNESCWYPFKEFRDEDPYAATRRAIVRAAAEIGRGME